MDAGRNKVDGFLEGLIRWRWSANPNLLGSNSGFWLKILLELDSEVLGGPSLCFLATLAQSWEVFKHRTDAVLFAKVLQTLDQLQADCLLFIGE